METSSADKDHTRLVALLMIGVGVILTLTYCIYLIVMYPTMSNNAGVALIMVIQAMISILTGMAGFYFGGVYKNAQTASSPAPTSQPTTGEGA